MRIVVANGQVIKWLEILMLRVSDYPLTSLLPLNVQKTKFDFSLQKTSWIRNLKSKDYPTTSAKRVSLEIQQSL